jgi:hypothetical protein
LKVDDNIREIKGQVAFKGKVSIERKGNLAETTKMLRKLYKILSAE